MKTFLLYYLLSFLPTTYCVQKYPTFRWLQICNSSHFAKLYLNQTKNKLIYYLKENKDDLYL